MRNILGFKSDQEERLKKRSSSHTVIAIEVEKVARIFAFLEKFPKIGQAGNLYD
jgi:hypothetical protein